MQNYTIVLFDSYGKEIERFTSTLSPIGAKTISTKKACYDIVETAIDYRVNHINLYVSDYTEYRQAVK